MIDFKKHLAENKLPVTDVVKVIKAIVGEKLKIQHTTPIVGIGDRRHVSISAQDYYLSFYLRGATNGIGGAKGKTYISNCYYCETPAGKTYNIGGTAQPGELVCSATPTEIWDKLCSMIQLTENILCPESACPKCWNLGKALKKGACKCEGPPWTEEVRDAPVELPPAPERLVGVMECFKVVMDFGTDRFNTVGTMYDKGVKMNGKQSVTFPNELIGHAVFYSREEAEKAAEKFRIYYNATKLKEKK